MLGIARSLRRRYGNPAVLRQAAAPREHGADHLCGSEDTIPCLAPDRRKVLSEFVLANTRQTSAGSLTPELSLHLVGPGCALWTATEHDLSVLKKDIQVETPRARPKVAGRVYDHSDPDYVCIWGIRSRIKCGSKICAPAPFWAFWWPGGQSIARYVLDNPQLVRGKRVLDLGSGAGGVGIAAKLAGAAHVTANDIDDCALVANAINARANGVSLESYEIADLIGGSSQNGSSASTCDNHWDVILAGDICYDAQFAAAALDWLQRSVRKGTHVLIGDPGRAYLPLLQQHLAEVAAYPLPPEVEDQNHGLVTGRVYQVLPQP